MDYGKGTGVGLLSWLFGQPDERGIALYEAAVSQARQPVFHQDLSVPDTIDGRFDLIILHLCLIRQALLEAGEEPGDGDLLQDMDERFIADMDYALREIGVGDLSVGKQVKAMAGAYQGRWARYQTAFSADDDAALSDAIVTNVYRKAAPQNNEPAQIAHYARAQVALLAAQPEQIRQARPLPWTAFAAHEGGGLL